MTRVKKRTADMIGPIPGQIKEWGKTKIGQTFAFPMNSDVLKALRREKLLPDSSSTLIGKFFNVNISKSAGEIIFVITVPAPLSRRY